MADWTTNERWLSRAALAVQARVNAWRARTSYTGHFRAVVIVIIDESWRSWKHDPEDLLGNECGVIERGRTGGYRQAPYDSMFWEFKGCLDVAWPGQLCHERHWNDLSGYYHKTMSIDDRAECMWIQGMRLTTSVPCVVGYPWTGQVYVWPESQQPEGNVWYLSYQPLLSGSFWTSVPIVHADDMDHIAGNWGLRTGSNDTLGLYDYDNSIFYLKSAWRLVEGISEADYSFIFRPSGGEGYSGWWPGKRFWPVVGDWDGDGIDGVGLYDPTTGTFYLRNSLSEGEADLVFSYPVANYSHGQGRYFPIAGNWDGSADNIDTIGVYDRQDGKFYLRNSNDSGSDSNTFYMGPKNSPYRIPVAGCWDGSGAASVALYNQADSHWLFRRSILDASTFDIGYGGWPMAMWKPFVGDWDGNGTDCVGVYAMELGWSAMRNTNITGCGDFYEFITPGQIVTPGCDLSEDPPPTIWANYNSSDPTNPVYYHTYAITDVSTYGVDNYTTHLAQWTAWMDSIGQHRDGGCGHQGVRLGIIQPVNPGKSEYPEQTLTGVEPPDWPGEYIIDSADHPFTGDENDLLPVGVTQLPGDSDRAVADHVILAWPGLGAKRVTAEDIIGLFNQMTRDGAWNPDLICIYVDGSPSMRPTANYYINQNINIHNNLTHQGVSTGINFTLEDEILKAVHHFRTLTPPTTRTPFGYAHPLVEYRLISEDWLGEAFAAERFFLDRYGENVDHFHIGDDAYWSSQRSTECQKYDCPGCYSP